MYRNKVTLQFHHFFLQRQNELLLGGLVFNRVTWLLQLCCWFGQALGVECIPKFGNNPLSESNALQLRDLGLFTKRKQPYNFKCVGRRSTFLSLQ
ncbi:hypothetical protein QL285_076389 [Trifolium repens]|nr:hypothetical protein QL285_076389 [Trifolium repens]